MQTIHKKFAGLDKEPHFGNNHGLAVVQLSNFFNIKVTGVIPSGYGEEKIRYSIRYVKAVLRKAEKIFEEQLSDGFNADPRITIMLTAVGGAHRFSSKEGFQHFTEKGIISFLMCIAHSVENLEDDASTYSYQ